MNLTDGLSAVRQMHIVTFDSPEPRQIDSWQIAEANAAEWMRYWGYKDARVTRGGADGGIDVRARKALAQVKFEAKQIGAPVLQQLLGAAARDDSKRLFFFTGAGYAQPALDYADDVGIALFKYDLTGHMTPVSSEAHKVLAEHKKRERASAANLDGSSTDAGNNVNGALGLVAILAAVMILLCLIAAAGAAYRLLTGSDQPSGLTLVISLGLVVAFAWSIAAMPVNKGDDRTTRGARLWPAPWVVAFATVSYAAFGQRVNGLGITAALLATFSLLAWAAGDAKSRYESADADPDNGPTVPACETDGYGREPVSTVIDASEPHTAPRENVAPKSMPLARVPGFSRVRALDFGSVEQIDGMPDAIDDVVPVWTDSEQDENPFGTVRVRGVLDSTHGLVWLPDDATVEIVEGPRFAGQLEDLIKRAKPLKAPEGRKGVLQTADGWPSIIWESDLVYSKVSGYTDPQISVEVILCALAVTSEAQPEVGDVLLAALKAQYAHVTRDRFTYPPDEYPWRGRTEPNKDTIDYLAGYLDG